MARSSRRADTPHTPRAGPPTPAAKGKPTSCLHLALPAQASIRAREPSPQHELAEERVPPISVPFLAVPCLRTSLHWPGCPLLIPQASDQLALFEEAFMGLGAESASPALLLPLPLRNPGHIVWCLSSAPRWRAGVGREQW